MAGGAQRSRACVGLGAFPQTPLAQPTVPSPTRLLSTAPHCSPLLWGRHPAPSQGRCHPPSCPWPLDGPPPSRTQQAILPGGLAPLVLLGSPDLSPSEPRPLSNGDPALVTHRSAPLTLPLSPAALLYPLPGRGLLGHVLGSCPLRAVGPGRHPHPAGTCRWWPSLPAPGGAQVPEQPGRTGTQGRGRLLPAAVAPPRAVSIGGTPSHLQSRWLRRGCPGPSPGSGSACGGGPRFPFPRCERRSVTQAKAHGAVRAIGSRARDPVPRRRVGCGGSRGASELPRAGGRVSGTAAPDGSCGPRAGAVQDH